MIGGMSGVEANIIPYGLYTGIRSNLRGLNLVGLKRKGLDKKLIQNILTSFKKIFDTKNNLVYNISKLSKQEKNISEVIDIIDFINLNHKRGVSSLK